MTSAPPRRGSGADHVASFARGLAVIRAFGPDAPRQTLSDVAERTGLSRAAARRFLITLVDLGFARSDGRLFELTPRVLELGYAYLSSLDIWEAAQPALDEVRRSLDESCSIAVLEDGEIVYVARSAARHRVIAIGLHIGTRLPAHATSMGQVLLAFLPEEERRQAINRLPLKAYTARTLTTRPALSARLRKIAREGYALVDQELEIGLRSIAVPIRDRRGVVVAAMNVSTHIARVSAEELGQRHLAVLRRAAAEVEASLRLK